MSEVIEVKLQRLSVNDDEYTFVERLVEDGVEVAAGALIASIESAKTVFEIEAPVAGFVFFSKAPRDQVAVGESIAVISQSPDLGSRSQMPERDDPASAKFTARALELVQQQRGIDPGTFRHLELVTSADVEAYLSQYASRADQSTT
jgi:pyruvate/2-oxoglutarate dehydrogenase complex dihydrolipoamide acyltransferase (E2) component